MTLKENNEQTSNQSIKHQHSLDFHKGDKLINTVFYKEILGAKYFHPS